MRRHEIPDDPWVRIEGLLPGRRGGHGGVAKDNRTFLNAVWYLAKTGIPWRNLPDRFGTWGTVYHRFNARRLAASLRGGSRPGLGMADAGQYGGSGAPPCRRDERRLRRRGPGAVAGRVRDEVPEA